MCQVQDSDYETQKITSRHLNDLKLQILAYYQKVIILLSCPKPGQTVLNNKAEQQYWLPLKQNQLI